MFQSTNLSQFSEENVSKLPHHGGFGLLAGPLCGTGVCMRHVSVQNAGTSRCQNQKIF
jgi:hypothetical protein